MAIAFVRTQATLTSASTNAPTAQFTGTTVTGNMIIVGVAYSGTSESVTSVTDSLSNSYILAKALSNQANGLDAEIWYCANPTGGANPTITVHMANAVANVVVFIYEFSGLATSSAADGTGQTGSGTGTSLPLTSSLVTTNANDLLFAIMCQQQTGTAGPASWTTESTYFSGAYRIVSSTGTYPATFTQTPSAAYSSAAFAFKATSGAPATTFAFSQATSALVNTTTAVASVPYGSNVTAGSLLFVGTEVKTSSTETCTISNTGTAGTVTWTPLAKFTTSGTGNVIDYFAWWGIAPGTGSCTPSVTQSGTFTSTNTGAICVGEWIPPPGCTVGGQDGSTVQTNKSTATTTLGGGAITPGNALDLIVAFYKGGGTLSALASGWSDRVMQSTLLCGLADCIPNSVSAQTFSATQTSSRGAIQEFAFKAVLIVPSVATASATASCTLRLVLRPAPVASVIALAGYSLRGLLPVTTADGLVVSTGACATHLRFRPSPVASVGCVASATLRLTKYTPVISVLVSSSVITLRLVIPVNGSISSSALTSIRLILPVIGIIASSAGSILRFYRRLILASASISSVIQRIGLVVPVDSLVSCSSSVSITLLQQIQPLALSSTTSALGFAVIIPINGSVGLSVGVILRLLTRSKPLVSVSGVSTLQFKTLWTQAAVGSVQSSGLINLGVVHRILVNSGSISSSIVAVPSLIEGEMAPVVVTSTAVVAFHRYAKLAPLAIAASSGNAVPEFGSTSRLIIFPALSTSVAVHAHYILPLVVRAESDTTSLGSVENTVFLAASSSAVSLSAISVRAFLRIPVQSLAGSSVSVSSHERFRPNPQTVIGSSSVTAIRGPLLRHPLPSVFIQTGSSVDPKQRIPFPVSSAVSLASASVAPHTIFPVVVHAGSVCVASSEPSHPTQALPEAESIAFSFVTPRLINRIPVPAFVPFDSGIFASPVYRSLPHPFSGSRSSIQAAVRILPWASSLANGNIGPYFPPVFVQKGNSGVPSGSLSSRSVTLDSDQTHGDLNVVVVSYGNQSGVDVLQVATVSDTNGNLYHPAGPLITQINSLTSQAIGLQVFYAPGVSSGPNTITVSTSAPVDFFAVSALEYSGAMDGSPFDTTTLLVANGPGASNLMDSMIGTTSNPLDIIIGAGCAFDGALSPGPGFTERDRFYTLIVEDQPQTTAGAYNAQAMSLSDTGWVMQMLAFKSLESIYRPMPEALIDTSAPIFVDPPIPGGVHGQSHANGSVHVTASPTHTPVVPGLSDYIIQFDAQFDTSTSNHIEASGTGPINAPHQWIPHTPDFTDFGGSIFSENSGTLNVYSVNAQNQLVIGEFSLGYIQGDAATAAAGTTCILQLDAASSAGDCLVLGIYWQTSTISSITDTAGNSAKYVAAGPVQTGGGFNMQMWIAPNIVASSQNTITITWAAAKGLSNALVGEYPNVIAASPIDDFTSGTGPTGTITMSLNSTAADAIMVAAVFGVGSGSVSKSGFWAHDVYNGGRPSTGFPTFSGVLTSLSSATGANSVPLTTTSATWLGAAVCLKPVSTAVQNRNRLRSGLISSMDQFGGGFTLAMGYWECRCKLPQSYGINNAKPYGIWPSFWLNDAEVISSDPGRYPLSEVDVFEVYGVDMTQAHFTIHNYTGTGDFGPGARVITFDPTVFHVWGCLIKPDFVHLYLDGVEVSNIPASPASLKPLFCMVDMATDGGWDLRFPEGPNNGINMIVDYVRAFSAPAFTGPTPISIIVTSIVGFTRTTSTVVAINPPAVIGSISSSVIRRLARHIPTAASAIDAATVVKRAIRHIPVAAVDASSSIVITRKARHIPAAGIASSTGAAVSLFTRHIPTAASDATSAVAITRLARRVITGSISAVSAVPQFHRVFEPNQAPAGISTISLVVLRRLHRPRPIGVSSTQTTAVLRRFAVPGPDASVVSIASFVFGGSSFPSRPIPHGQVNTFSVVNSTPTLFPGPDGLVTSSAGIVQIRQGRHITVAAAITDSVIPIPLRRFSRPNPLASSSISSGDAFHRLQRSLPVGTAATTSNAIVSILGFNRPNPAGVIVLSSSVTVRRYDYPGPDAVSSSISLAVLKRADSTPVSSSITASGLVQLRKATRVQATALITDVVSLASFSASAQPVPRAVLSSAASATLRRFASPEPAAVSFITALTVVETDSARVRPVPNALISASSLVGFHRLTRLKPVVVTTASATLGFDTVRRRSCGGTSISSGSVGPNTVKRQQMASTISSSALVARSARRVLPGASSISAAFSSVSGPLISLLKPAAFVEAEGGVPASPFFNQFMGGSGNLNPGAIFTQPTSAGHLLVALVVWDTTGSPTVNLTDSFHNNWIQLDPIYNSVAGFSQVAFSTINIGGVGTLTVTAHLSTLVVNGRIEILEYSSASQITDGSNHNSDLSLTAMSSGLVSTTHPQDLLIAQIRSSAHSENTLGPGWTERLFSFANEYGSADNITSVTGSYEFTANSLPPWAVSIYAFKSVIMLLTRPSPGGFIVASSTVVIRSVPSRHVDAESDSSASVTMTSGNTRPTPTATSNSSASSVVSRTARRLPAALSLAVSSVSSTKFVRLLPPAGVVSSSLVTIRRVSRLSVNATDVASASTAVIRSHRELPGAAINSSSSISLKLFTRPQTTGTISSSAIVAVHSPSTVAPLPHGQIFTNASILLHQLGRPRPPVSVIASGIVILHRIRNFPSAALVNATSVVQVRPVKHIAISAASGTTANQTGDLVSTPIPAAIILVQGSVLLTGPNVRLPNPKGTITSSSVATLRRLDRPVPPGLVSSAATSAFRFALAPKPSASINALSFVHIGAPGTAEPGPIAASSSSAAAVFRKVVLPGPDGFITSQATVVRRSVQAIGGADALILVNGSGNTRQFDRPKPVAAIISSAFAQPEGGTTGPEDNMTVEITVLDQWRGRVHVL